MRLILIFSVIILLSEARHLNKTSSRLKIQENIQVIQDVVTELYVRHSIEFDFVLFGQPAAKVTDTINELLKKEKEIKKVYRVDNNLGSWTGPYNDTSDWSGKAGLIFVSNLESFIDFLMDFSDTQSKLLFFIPEHLKFDDSKVSNSNRWNTENYFLIESKSRIELKTFRRWTSKSCDIKYFVPINTFTTKWINPLIIPERFSNMNGCTLKVIINFILLPTFEIILEMGLTNIHPTAKPIIEKRDAREDEILKIFAEERNFKVTKVPRFADHDLQIFMSVLCSTQRCTDAVFDYHFIFMVSAPEPYTNYEKMLLPFDTLTWYYLLGVFCAAFIGIFFLNLTPAYFRDLVYGRNVNMPSFNVIGTLFGIGQTKLPDNNFGRIILMTFILFCLIFRVGYQGNFILWL